jgi:hypothetical protein
VDLPKGSSVHGAVCVYDQIWGFANKAYTLQNVYGSARYPAMAFEGSANELARSIFPNLSARQVLEQHTLFGFYSRAHTVQNADRWAEGLLAETNRKGGLAKTYHAGLSERAVKNQYYFCADCVREDLGEYGFATWRFLHQVPGLDYCPEHRRRLVAFCSACGEPYAEYRSLSTPGQPCTACGAAVRRPGASPSIGAAQLAMDCSSLAAGRLPELRPLAWALTVSAYVKAMGKHALSELMREIGATWSEGSSPCLRRTLIERELDLLNAPAEIVVRLVVYGALARMGFTQAAGQPVNSIEAAVQETLVDRLLPAGLAQGLLQKEGITQLSRSVGTTTTKLRAAVSTLAPAVRSYVTPAETCRVNHSPFPPARNLTFEQRRKKCRTEVESVLAQMKSATRTQLQQKIAPQLVWLRANDRKWLEKTLPPVVGSQRKKSPFSRNSPSEQIKLRPSQK